MKNIKNLTSGNFPEIIPDKLNYIYIALILIMVIINFVPDFYHSGEKDSLNYNYVKYDLTEEQENSFWIDNLNSGTPYYPLKKSPENRFFITFLQKIEQVLDWRIIFVFFSGIGTFLYLKFRKLKSILALMGALAYTLSIKLVGDSFWYQSLTILAICYFPWLILSAKYLKERKSIFAFSLHTIFLILIIKTMCWEMIFLSIMLLIVFYINDFNKSNTKEALYFTILSIIAFIIALLASSYPSLYLIYLFKEIKISSTILNFKIIGFTLFLSLASITIPTITQHILKRMENSGKNFIKSYRIILINVGAFLLILSWSLFMFSRSIPDLRILGFLSFLILYCILSLLILSGFLSKKIFLISIFSILLIVLTGLNFYQYWPRDISIGSKDKRVQKETDSFLDNDDNTFRLFSISKNQKNCMSNSNFCSIKNDFSYTLENYNYAINKCLFKEIENRVPLNWNLLDMLNVKYIIHQGKLPFQHLEYAFYDINEEHIIYRNRGYLSRAWFVNNLEFWENSSLILERVNDLDFNPNNTAILGSRLSNISSPANSEIKIIQNKKENISYQTQNDSTSFMVFSEIFYPKKYGWKGFIDEQPADIYQVNHILRGMIVPAGKHDVQMIFAPDHFNLLVNINLYTILLIVILLIIGLIQYLKENYKGEIIYVLRK